jgi:hypothetical protein
MAMRNSAEEGSGGAGQESSGNAGRAAGGASGSGGGAKKRAPQKTAAKKTTRKSTAKEGAGDTAAPRKGAGRIGAAAAAAIGSRRRGGKSPDLTRDLRDFASGRPDGWDHDDWEAFLDHLRGRGHDTSNADAIGLALERERLALALQKVEGIGPQRIRALTDRFITLWSLRNAEVEDIASAASIRRDLAERIKASV